MEFGVVKNALVPADHEAHKRMEELSIGERVRVRILQAPRFRDQVHMVVKRVGAAAGVKNARAWLALATGHFDLVAMPGNGRMVMVPHSTAEMTKDEFDGFWDDARLLIANGVLPELPEAEAADIRAMLERVP